MGHEKLSSNAKLGACVKAIHIANHIIRLLLHFALFFYFAYFVYIYIYISRDICEHTKLNAAIQ